MLVFLVLVGCATIRLHFAPYTPDADLLAIENQKTHTAITDVTGIERCSTCSEMSKIVWHAANYNGGLYEGFANIPVANWPEFIRQAIGSDAAANIKTRVEIERVFVKLGIVQIITLAKRNSPSMWGLPNMSANPR